MGTKTKKIKQLLKLATQNPANQSFNRPNEKHPTRASFMPEFQRIKLAGMVRTHENCAAFTGVMRPGKTAKDRYLHQRQS